MGAAIMLSGRMTRLLKMCIEYYADAFGAPNHLLFVLVARLFFALPKIIVPLDDCPECGKAHSIEAIHIIDENNGFYFGFCENAQCVVRVERESADVD